MTNKSNHTEAQANIQAEEANSRMAEAAAKMRDALVVQQAAIDKMREAETLAADLGEKTRKLDETIRLLAERSDVALTESIKMREAIERWEARTAAITGMIREQYAEKVADLQEQLAAAREEKSCLEKKVEELQAQLEAYRKAEQARVDGL